MNSKLNLLNWNDSLEESEHTAADTEHGCASGDLDPDSQRWTFIVASNTHHRIDIKETIDWDHQELFFNFSLIQENGSWRCWSPRGGSAPFMSTSRLLWTCSQDRNYLFCSAARLSEDQSVSSCVLLHTLCKRRSPCGIDSVISLLGSAGNTTRQNT